MREIDLVGGRLGFVFVLAAIVGCAKPIAPTMATATKALVVCWTDPRASSDDEKKFYAAFKQRLESAGYDTISRVCDIDFAFGFRWREEAADKYYSEVTLVVSDGSGEVETIKLETEAYDFPVENPDRLAIVLVNRLNASEKLAKVAKEHETNESLRKREDLSCTDKSGLFKDDCRPSKSKNLIQSPR